MTKFNGYHILFIILFLLFLVKINSCKKTEVRTVTIRDTVLQPDTVIMVDTVTNIDTVFVIKEFFKKKIYRDTITLKGDSLIIRDTIYQNRLLRRTYQTINIAPEPQKRLNLGIYGGYNTIGIFGGYKLKKARIYAGFGTNGLLVGISF